MSDFVIGVIADDLTGVTDTGAQFATRGLRTIGSLDISLPSGFAEVIVLNTQSRCMKSEDAATECRKAAETISTARPEYVLKKIDTALRGNIGIEVATILETLDYRMAAFIGAIPRIGRTTRGGYQLYHGVPIQKSIVGSDPNNPNPVFTSDIQELFFGVPKCEVEKVTLRELRSKCHPIIPPRHGFRKIIVFDIETTKDLDEAVRMTSAVSDRFLYVGSLGLADSLAKMIAPGLPGSRDEESELEEVVRHNYQQVLFVSGSPNPTTREQIQKFKFCSQVEFFELEPISLLTDPHYLVESESRVERAIVKGGKAFLYLKPNAEKLNNQSVDLAKTYARLVRNILRSTQIDAMVINGGETAYWVCRTVGIEGIEIGGAISVVAAYGKPLPTQSDLKLIITKGGSVGEEAIFNDILQFIDSLSSS